MSKTPEALAREYADRELRSPPMYINGLYDGFLDGFLAGYKAAQAIVEDELQAVQAQRVERPGLGSAEYALKSVVAKLGANENT